MFQGEAARNQGQSAAEEDAKTKVNGAPTNAPQNKPVACNLCNRRFKNIPALNGHMRLHGGYFKKVRLKAICAC